MTDTVAGFIAALGTDKAIGETINLGSNYEISIGDAAKVIAEVMQTEIELVTDEQRLRPINSEVERLWADNRKAHELLGWQPLYGGLAGFRRGVTETAAWFSERGHFANYKPDIYNL